MPFRCTACNKVVQVVEDQTCCDNSNFKQCPKIHYLHNTAPGPIYSRHMRKKGIGENKKELNIEDATVLRLACDTKKVLEQATVMPSLVSCPLCLEFLNSIRPVKPDVETKPPSLDKVDLSQQDIDELKAMGLNPDFVSP